MSQDMFIVHDFLPPKTINNRKSSIRTIPFLTETNLHQQTEANDFQFEGIKYLFLHKQNENISLFFSKDLTSEFFPKW
jgi:hypothetical protein